MRTHDEIKKGLRCCVNGCSHEEHCPYSGDYDCNWVLMEDANELVQQQQDRYERLMEIVKTLNDALKEYQRRCEE